MPGGEGTAFGKYFLLKKIAAGGMGEIYLAKIKGPVGFEKLLVIKRILQHHVENEEFVDMFFAEARVAAQLNHSNIVQIYEMGEIEDAYFIAMEYCHGKGLRDIVDRARQMGDYIPPAHGIEIIAKLCAGLSYAHNARDMSGEPLSIIHRDINPHNLLISYAGDVKIIDFGIAKSEMSLHKTETGTIKGKFVYMSPEQSAAEKLDKRSDIFSVGICLYETLTFNNPFAKANVVLSLDAIQRKEPPPVSELTPKLAPFEPIVAKALAKNRENRYQDCSEMRKELLALLESGAIPKPPQSLADYMHDLFEEQIEQEKRMIVETDSANTSQIQQMRHAGRREHSESQQLRTLRPETGSARIAAHAAAVDVIEEERSRAPFLLLLAAIIVFTGVAAVAVTKFVRPVKPVRPTLALVPAPKKEAPKVDPPPKAEAEVDSKDPPVARRDREPRRKKKGDTRAGGVARAPEHEPEPKRAAEPKRAPEAKKPPPEPPKAPEPPKLRPNPPAPPSPSFGSMQLSTSPPVKIYRGGAAIGQTIPKIKNAAGTLVFGRGSDPARDPFKVTVKYRIAGGEISYEVDAEPWAIVRGKGGIGLGKTPLALVKGGTTTVLELLNPKERLRLRITLRYSPP